MHAFRLIREPRRPSRQEPATPRPTRNRLTGNRLTGIHRTRIRPTPIHLTRTRPALTPLAGNPLTRALRPAAALLGVAALLALPGVAHGMGTPRPVPPPRVVAAGELTVVYDDGSGRPRTYDLACGPQAARGADRAGEQDGCRHLQEIGGPVGAVPAGQMCSMIYGGPQTADVRGTWAGRPVAESYRRTNGCEVSRWSRMVPALPNPVSPPAQTVARTSTRTPALTTAWTPLVRMFFRTSDPALPPALATPLTGWKAAAPGPNPVTHTTPSPYNPQPPTL